MKKRPIQSIPRIVLLIMVISLAFVFINPIPGMQAAPSDTPLIANQDAAATPVPTLTPVGQVLPTQYSEGSMVLVLAIIVLLGGMFFLLLWWSNKLDQASYLGSVYRDTIEEIEYGRIVTALREKWEKGVFHRDVEEDNDWLAGNPKPELPPELVGYYPDYDAYNPGYDTNPYAPVGVAMAPGTGGWGTGSRSDADPQKVKKDKYEADLRAWRNKVHTEAIRRYRKELTLGREKAKSRADSAVSVDLSVLRGRGTEFVLEFTTVVVIIFAAVILGILQILDTQQIGTLLAAIAGYVLGRATTRTKDTETVTPAKITELSELLLASKGITKTSPGSDTSQKQTQDTTSQAKIDELIALIKAQAQKEPGGLPGGGSQGTTPAAPGSPTGQDAAGSSGENHLEA